MRKSSSKLLVAAALLALSAPLWAKKLAPGAFGFSGDRVEYTDNPSGARLDGNAIIRIPEFEIAADAIAFDGKNLKDFTEARGRGNVNLRLSPTPKSGQEAIQIRSKSDEATFTVTNRTLLLKGDLSGFYKVGNSPQTMLSGDKATFNFALSGLNALIEGASGKQVELLLPAETGRPDGLGPVTVRSNTIRIDQANKAIYFSGQARAFSNDGANKLDVTAPSFTLVQGADGAIGTLTTNGKTLTKLNVAVAPDTPPTAGALTYVEVTADKATVNRATSTGVFEGNVKGFYRLQNSPKQFPFSGELITITYDAQAAKTGDGLIVVADGTPFDVELPPFSLNF